MKAFHKLLIIAAISAPLFSSAQGNYKPGFIVTAGGDTVKGYIQLRNWSNNPTSINFKQTLKDVTPQSMTVNDIKYFEIPRIIAYRQYAGPISLDETNLTKLEYIRDTTFRMDNVFLKVEDKGKNLTLYSYADDIKTRYYLYDRMDDKIRELTYRIYFIPSNNFNVLVNVATVSQDAWKQQLILIAEKYGVYTAKLRFRIEDANYTEGYIGPIVRKINEAAGPK